MWEIWGQFGNLLFSVLGTIAFFIIGAGVLMLGLELGFFMLRHSRTKKTNWKRFAPGFAWRCLAMLFLGALAGNVASNAPKIALTPDTRATEKRINTISEAPLPTLKPPPYLPTTPEERTEQLRKYDREVNAETVDQKE